MTEHLDQLFALYRQAFPANERRPESDLQAAIQDPAYHVLTKLHGGKLCGFAILFTPREATCALLEYLAVDSIWKNQGIGRELVRRAIAQRRERVLLAEIEIGSTSSAAFGRQNFYRSCEFVRLDGLQYQLPLPGNPPPMELWIHPRPADAIDRKEVESWLRTIYTQVYSCTADDPRIGQMLSTFTGAKAT